ncbi:MAG: outer membrane protein [Rhodomicrobium sp.]
MSVGKFFHACAVAAGLTIGACAAEAADLPGGYKDAPVFVPPFFWQGVYAGGFAGIAWADIQAADDLIILTSSGIVPVGPLSSTGFMGGTQFGYNFQAGRFVYGIEAELGGLDDGANVNFSNRALSGLLQINSSGGFYGSVTGRAGIVSWNTLFYAKAGFAFFTGDVSLSDYRGVTLEDSGTFTGWTVGAGVEYPIAPNWTVKAEYQYFDLSDSNSGCCGNFSNTITANAVKIGFNWFVHAIPSPLY